MKRSTFLTWEQLKVGALILVALIVLTVGMFRLGQAANLFAERYPLVTFVPNANGLRVGGGVLVAGQLAGTITEIEFLPPDRDTTRNLAVVMEIDEALIPLLRENSRARIRTQGLLGDKVIDVSPGTPPWPALEPGDTVPLVPTVDYEQVLAQAAEAVDDVVALTADLRQITGTIVEGEGTIGQLLTNRTLYDELTTTAARANQVLARFENPSGTVGRLLNDPTLYDRLTSTLATTDSLLVLLQAPNSSFGRLVRSDTLYTNLVGAVAAADTLLSRLASGEGTAARLINDQQLYDQLLKTVTELNVVLTAIRQNPDRYLEGLINVDVF